MGVEPVMIVPDARTARRRRMAPSYTPQLPPTITSSSTITGTAPTGSSTPPICAAALRCTFLPICAHEPTSACESTSVPSPTYAPTLMYIGGMQMTPGARYAPSRMADPPGTTRTPLAGSIRFIGSVSLSKKDQRPFATPMSTTSPKRNPSRMPCFTQTLTRQPVGDDASGSAERTVPSESSSRRRRNASRASSRGAFEPCSNRRVMRSARVLMNPWGEPSRLASYTRRRSKHLQVLQHAHHLLARGRARRDHRQPVVLLEQPHRRHRRLHRHWVGLDEVHLAERQQPRVQAARRRVVVVLGQLHDVRHLRRRHVRRHRDDAAAAHRHRGHRQRVVAAEQDELARGRREDLAHLDDVAGGFLHADDVGDCREPDDRRDVDVDARAPRHVVDDDRQPRRVGNRLVMLVEAFRRRLVVVRRDREDAVGADLLDVAHERDGLARVVPAGAREDRHAPAGFLDDELDHAKLLAVRQRRRLAGGPDRRQEVNAAVDLAPRQAAHRRLVDRAVFLNGVTNAVPTPVKGVLIAIRPSWKTTRACPESTVPPAARPTRSRGGRVPCASARSYPTARRIQWHGSPEWRRRASTRCRWADRNRPPSSRHAEAARCPTARRAWSHDAPRESTRRTAGAAASASRRRPPSFRRD